MAFFHQLFIILFLLFFSTRNCFLVESLVLLVLWRWLNSYFFHVYAKQLWGGGGGNSIETERERETACTQNDFSKRLVWFQCKVTILFKVFKLAPAPHTRTRRATAATKYSMLLMLKKVYEVKQANNISRTCKTEQEAQQNTL